MKSMVWHIVIVVQILVIPLTDTGLAQFPIPRGVKAKLDAVTGKMRDIELTQDEEVSLGKEISARVRGRYGVVQDQEIHKYVSLVGNVLTRQTPQAGMAWQFIVLDTDGVNAFAAPGGFVHLTRGALALMKSEAELAGVLSHELAHVTMKHTVRAIQKNKLVQMGVNDANVTSNQELFKRLADEGTRIVMSGFGRAEELEADGEGIATAEKAGYSASSLKTFLTAIKLRNDQSNERQGFFSSHPELEERLQKIDARIEQEKWAGSVLLNDRFSSNVKYNSVALAEIGTVEAKAEAPSVSQPEKKEEPPKTKSRFSLGKLKNAVGGGSQTTQSAAVTGSGGSRGVDVERSAKGGSNPNEVSVTLTENDIANFISEGKLRS
jgi:beta-barrel assembly-enhancing protease